MGLKIKLYGDANASSYISFAKKKLIELKKQKTNLHLNQIERRFNFNNDNITIKIKSFFNIDEIEISSIETKTIIIAYVGEATYDYSNKKYYKLINNTLIEITKIEAENILNKTLIDDGAYYPIFTGEIHQNPFDYAYSVYGDGIDTDRKIPAMGSGITAKKYTKLEDGTSVIRYVLTSQNEIENMMVSSTDYYEKAFMNLNSLVMFLFNFENIYSQNPKYIDDYVVFGNMHYLNRINNILILDGNWSANFNDYANKMSSIYIAPLNINEDISTIDIIKVNPNFDAYIINMNIKEDKVNVLQPKVDYGFTDIDLYQYDIQNKNGEKITTIINRCINNDNNCAYYSYNILRGWTQGTMCSDDCDNQPNFVYRKNCMWSFLKNNMNIPFYINEDKTLNYINYSFRYAEGNECIKDNIIEYKTGIYCANKLVDGIDWTTVKQYYSEYEDLSFGLPELHTDPNDPNYSAVAYNNTNPLYIFPVRYRPYFSFQNDNFNLLVYGKTEFISLKERPFKKTINNNDTYFYSTQFDTSPTNCVSGQFPIRETEIKSKLSYYIYWNNNILKLDNIYSYFSDRYLNYYPRLVNPYFDKPSDANVSYANPLIYEYHSVNYDWNSDNIINEKGELAESFVISRFFADGNNEFIILAFDVFKDAYFTDIIQGDNFSTGSNFMLLPKVTKIIYDLDTPFSDAKPLYDRKLFKLYKNGDYLEIPSFKDKNGKNYERLNGMGVFNVS